MMEYSGLIIDGILALLLIAVIVVCLRVSNRFGTIRSGQAELKVLVDELNAAVMGAQQGVSSLKSSADEVDARLKLERQKASAIADELAIMTEAGNNLANRIESGLMGARAGTSAGVGVSKVNVEKQEEILAALKEAR